MKKTSKFKKTNQITFDELIRLTVNHYCMEKYGIQEETVVKEIPHKNIYPILRRCAVVVLAIIGVTAAMLLVSPEARTYAGFMFEQQRTEEDHAEGTDVQVNNDYGFKSYPSDYQWRCGYIPEGYELVLENIFTGLYGRYEYRSLDDNVVIFTYWTKDGNPSSTIDFAELEKQNPERIEDESGISYMIQDGTQYCLYWERDGFYFTLYGNGKEECIQIREGIY